MLSDGRTRLRGLQRDAGSHVLVVLQLAHRHGAHLVAGASQTEPALCDGGPVLSGVAATSRATGARHVPLSATRAAATWPCTCKRQGG